MTNFLKEKNKSEGKYLKTPSTEADSTQSRYPVFSFRFLQEGTYGIKKCQTANIIKQIQKVSQMQWGVWLDQDRTKTGFEKINKTSIKTEIPNEIPEDVNFFLAFRFKKGRIVGFRVGIVFYIRVVAQ